MLRPLVIRTLVVAGQPAGATSLKEVVDQSRVLVGQAARAMSRKEVFDQLSRPRQYLGDAGKVVAKGIVLLVVARDVSDGAHRAIEIERLYDEGQFDEFTRDHEQVRNAAHTGGRVAGTITGVWLG